MSDVEGSLGILLTYLNVLFFSAISSGVGGGGRSFSDKTLVDEVMDEEESVSIAKYLPMPSFIEDVTR